MMSGTPRRPWGFTRQRAVFAPKGSLVDAGGVLAPDGEALGGEEGQDGAGDFAGRHRAEVEQGLLVFGGYGHGGGLMVGVGAGRGVVGGAGLVGKQVALKAGAGQWVAGGQG